MDWWLVEGFSKWLLFLAFWFLTPVLPRALVRQVSSPLAFLTALYAVALLAAGANLLLPADWKFLPEPPSLAAQAETNRELTEAAAPPEQTGRMTITRSPILAEHAKWMERQEKTKYPRVVAGVLILVGTFAASRLFRSLILQNFVVPRPAAGDRAATEVEPRAVVVGAWLFAVGTALDFAKWWFTR